MPNVPKGAKAPTDRLAAEAKAVDGPDEMVMDLNGTPIRVLNPMDWDKNAAACMTTLDFAGWAEAAVVPDDLEKFNATKASIRQTLLAIKAVSEGASVDVGEFFAS